MGRREPPQRTRSNLISSHLPKLHSAYENVRAFCARLSQMKPGFGSLNRPPGLSYLSSDQSAKSRDVLAALAEIFNQLVFTKTLNHCASPVTFQNRQNVLLRDIPQRNGRLFVQTARNHCAVRQYPKMGLEAVTGTVLP